MNRTVLLALSLLFGACSATRSMSRSGAPATPGCCGAAVAAGEVLLVSRGSPRQVSSYDIAQNEWRDVSPDAPDGSEFISLGERAAIIGTEKALIYDPRERRWTLFEGPGFQWTRLDVQRQYVIALRGEGSHGPTLSGSAVLDLATLRWHRVPAGPASRRAPYFILGDSLVLLPGVGTCPWSPCRDPRIASGMSDAWVAQPSMAWRIGDAEWMSIEGGPLAFYFQDPVASVGGEVIGRAESAKYFVVDGTELKEARTGPRQWWRLSAEPLRWERLEGPMVELAPYRTFTTRRHALFAGRETVVLYDATAKAFVATPQGLRPQLPDYMLRANDGRVVLLDGERLPKQLVDFENGIFMDVADHGLPRIDHGRRWFALEKWTGRCLIRWGETTSPGPTAAEQCRDAPRNQGCDPVNVPVEYTTRGYLWCLPRSRGL